MAVLVENSSTDENRDDASGQRFITRQQERNRKKKLKKKASKLRRREVINANPYRSESSQAPVTSSNEDTESDAVVKDDFPEFLLTGPFERFKVSSPV